MLLNMLSIQQNCQIGYSQHVIKIVKEDEEEGEEYGRFLLNDQTNRKIKVIISVMANIIIDYKLNQ